MQVGSLFPHDYADSQGPYKKINATCPFPWNSLVILVSFNESAECLKSKHDKMGDFGRPNKKKNLGNKRNSRGAFHLHWRLPENSQEKNTAENVR